MDLIRQFELYWRASGRSQLTSDTYAVWLRRVEQHIGHELPPTLMEAREWVSLQRDNGMKSATLHVGVRSMKAFSKWWGSEFDEADPLAKLPYPKTDEPEPGAIAEDDAIDNLLRPMKGKRDFVSVRDTAIVVVLRDTGMRRSELMRLKVDDVDLEGGTLTVTKTKSKRSRLVPLSRHARLCLVRYLRVRESKPWGAHIDGLWLSSTRHCAMRPDSMGPLFERLERSSGVHLTPHQFRRGLSARWAKAGGSDDALMQIAGWSSPVMPARYRRKVVQQLAFDQYKRIIDN